MLAPSKNKTILEGPILQYATEVKSLDGTLMRRVKDYGGSMSICPDLLSTALYSGILKGGDVPFPIQPAN